MIATQEKSVLSLSEIKWLGEPIALYHPLDNDQQTFHHSIANARWLFGGNQSGKTHTNMMDLALLCLDIHPIRRCSKGLHWVCIESWEQVRDILWEDKLKKFIPAHHIYDIAYGQDHVPRKVYLRNGHIIEFKAFNQGRNLFQGRAIDDCRCDEQCEHDFQGIFNELQARLMAKNGKLSWSMTPIIPQPLLEERMENLPETDEIFHIDLNSNRLSEGGYIEDKRIDDLIEEWPEEVQATRIEGKFASFYGAVYKTFSRQLHMIQPFAIPECWPKFRSFDFGFTNPFACLWGAMDGDGNWYIYREYYKAKTGIHEHIASVNHFSKNETYFKNIADPEDADARNELRKVGIITISARKDVSAGIEHVQSKLKIKSNGKPSLFIFNTCRNTLREMAVYHYPKGSNSKNPKDVPEAVDDHTVDALRYMLYTIEKPFAKGKIV